MPERFAVALVYGAAKVSVWLAIENQGFRLWRAIRSNSSRASSPDPAEPEKYHQWRDALDDLRREIREQNRQYLQTARLAGMTATYATSQFDDLTTAGGYHLVVFDEASQVGKAHAMTLARLGRRVLFAGDPQQLSAIVQAKTEAVSTWLGESAFAWASRTSLKEATCMLTEQWRMAEPISNLVSDLFYESKLIVARPALNDPQWASERTARKTTLLEPNNVVLISLRAVARAAYKFLGYYCPESAEIVAALMIDLRMSCPDQELLILTPYRAQRREIRRQIQSLNGQVSLVSTVHRAQGSERRIVIFDPVRPSSEFVAGEEGMRLVNVALSRAECRLIVLMQADWADNRALRFLGNRFPLTELDWTKVQRLLNTKLPRVLKPKPAIKITPKPATLIEKFQQELLLGLLSRPNTAEHRRQFVLDLAGRAGYRRLTYSEIEGAKAAISTQLPPFSGPALKPKR